MNQQKDLVIALLLPFQSDNVYQLENGKFHFGEESQWSVEYFQGASLAVDSLNKAGIHCRLLVFDAGNDSIQLKSVLKRMEALRVSLIVTPLNAASVQVVADFAKQHGIVCCSPYSTAAVSSLPNDLFVYANPMPVTHWERMLDFIRQQFSLRNIFVVYEKENEKMLSLLREYLSVNFPQEKAAIIALGDTGSLSFMNFDLWRNKDSQNQVLILSDHESFVAKVCHSIHAVDSTVNIYGMPPWQSFSAAESDFSRLNVFISASYSIVDTLNSYRSFKQNYLQEFQQSPTISALTGFDQIFCFAESWRKPSSANANFAAFGKCNGTIHRFNFQPVRDQNEKILYYENEATFILKFTGSFFSLYE